jgi:hypothetical protein
MILIIISIGKWLLRLESRGKKFSSSASIAEISAALSMDFDDACTWPNSWYSSQYYSMLQPPVSAD